MGKNQINKIIDETRYIVSDNEEIWRSKRTYLQNFILPNKTKMDNFLDTYHLSISKLNQKCIYNLKRTITPSEI